MTDQGETNSVRLSPHKIHQDALKTAYEPGHRAAHLLQPEHAQGRGGAVLEHLTAMIGSV